MFLIFGLGNPGRQYEKTRHNVGFLALDHIAKHHQLEFKSHKFNSLYAEATLQESKGFLIKPQTYMNLSGTSAREFSTFYKVPTENIIVIHDDIDLAFGQLKHKFRGGDAGHQGVRSIAEALGTLHFHRLRIGVGRPLTADIDVSDYVLSAFSREEMQALESTLISTTEKLEKLLAELHHA